MSGGIRAEVSVDAGGTCPVQAVSAATDTRTSSVSRGLDPDHGETIAEEFLLDSDVGATQVDTDVALESVFSYGERDAYRFTRERGRGCPCECVERNGSPVVDVHANNGRLHLTFHAADMECLQDIVTCLRTTYHSLDIQRLLRSTHDKPEQQLVFVDRGTLTDRQQEVLSTAHELGYFDHPKGANAGEVAFELGISSTTFSEHLSVAQSKLLDAILRE